MRRIGLHVQVDDTLVNVSKKADRLGIDSFQCFLCLKTEGRLIPFSEEDIHEFVTTKRKNYKELYLHSSYWVNLSDVKRSRHPLLKREIDLAKRLKFDAVVLHSGSSKNAKNKQEAIKALARSVNWLLENNQGLQVILENVAHGGNAVGNDLHDFKQLLTMIEQPEKLFFCIDVAHAYLYGYDIVDPEKRERFIELVDSFLGWDRVALIHLNDTQEKVGSRIDQHYNVGEGSIGDEALKAFVLHPKIRDIPVIMEIPTLPEEQQKRLLEKVRGWHKE